jgi:hypothetical protein
MITKALQNKIFKSFHKPPELNIESYVIGGCENLILKETSKDIDMLLWQRYRISLKVSALLLKPKFRFSDIWYSDVAL